MTVLSVDPGVHKQACAEWGTGLIRVGYDLRPDEVDLVVVERPVIRGNATPNPQDIVDLAWAGAGFARSFGVRVVEYTPTEWKGSKPKPMHHSLCMKRGLLTTRELGTLAMALPGFDAEIDKAVQKGARDGWKKPGAYYYGKWEGHNLLDAVFLGAYARSKGVF